MNAVIIFLIASFAHATSAAPSKSKICGGSLTLPGRSIIDAYNEQVSEADRIQAEIDWVSENWGYDHEQINFLKMQFWRADADEKSLKRQLGLYYEATDLYVSFVENSSAESDDLASKADVEKFRNLMKHRILEMIHSLYLDLLGDSELEHFERILQNLRVEVEISQSRRQRMNLQTFPWSP